MNLENMAKKEVSLERTCQSATDFNVREPSAEVGEIRLSGLSVWTVWRKKWLERAAFSDLGPEKE